MTKTFKEEAERLLNNAFLEGYSKGKAGITGITYHKAVQDIEALQQLHDAEVAMAYEHGTINGSNIAIAHIKSKSVNFKHDNQCYVIPTEQIDTFGEQQQDSTDYELLSKKYKRWHVLSRDGSKTLYVAVTHNNSSYAITVQDGQIRTSSLLATNVAALQTARKDK